MLSIDICHLYPDILNLYGDRGNVIALKMRSLWRGIGVNIHNVSLEDPFCPEIYDIVFLGGGQDYEQQIIRQDLIEEKGAAVRDAIENGTVFLCICGGYQLLGNYYRSPDGVETEFLGALDFWTIAEKKRLTGNIVFDLDLPVPSNGTRVVGFENHAGRTWLGEGVKPLGRVVTGFGNNGRDGFEGAVYKNTICTYCHGSLLPKNPALADYLVETALRRKYGDSFTGLAELDDSLEIQARNVMVNRLTTGLVPRNLS
jgi:CobQ-like glutamine amidotransferase family enzyme